MEKQKSPPWEVYRTNNPDLWKSQREGREEKGLEGNLDRASPLPPPSPLPHTPPHHTHTTTMFGLWILIQTNCIKNKLKHNLKVKGQGWGTREGRHGDGEGE